MSKFISGSLCEGHRPRRYFDTTIHSRPELLSRLMRERQVARFLVAPCGYGKTYVALDYAQVIFQFQGTAWIPAQSPCFLRDLDTLQLANDLMKHDENLKLVVFDNVPRLGSTRAGVFSEVIDALLEQSIEVIVTCHPPCDAYSGRQIDRICLKASDLLLSDTEVIAIKHGFSDSRSSMSDSISELFAEESFNSDVLVSNRLSFDVEYDWFDRIPQFVWGDANALVEFVTGVKYEELPEDSLAAMFVLLTLNTAPLPWICNQFNLALDNVIELSNDYPHLGIFKEAETFHTIEIPQTILQRVFIKDIDAVVKFFGFNDGDELAWKLSDILLELGNPSRACEHVSEFCQKQAKADWAKTYALRLFSSRCTLPAYYLVKSIIDSGGSSSAVSLFETQNAWRLMLLGDTRSAVECAMRVISHNNATADERAWSLLLLAHNALKESVLDGVYERLNLLVQNKDNLEAFEERDWYPLAICSLEARRAKKGEIDENFSEVVWPQLLKQATYSDIVFWGASHLMASHPEIIGDLRLRKIAEQAQEQFTSAHLFAFRKFKDFVDIVESNNLSNIQNETNNDTYQEACKSIKEFMTEQIIQNLAKAEQRLMAEIELYRENSERSKKQINRQPGTTSSKTILSVHEKQTDIPVLTVNVLGGFELERDGVPLSAKAFGQMKVRALLTLLVLADGREKSKMNIVDSLWPKLSERSGVKNLYTTWSNLLRALSLPDGSNPYIVRSQGSYRIVKQFVQSDISRVNQICKEVTMGQVSQEHLCSLLDELNRVYKGDLLPSETKNEWILDERRRYRHQVSNLFANASMQLVDMNQPQTALWFSQIAMRHEKQREDMYYALMTSQLACNQRESALETYHSCTKMLADQFGIDPSIRMVTLFKSIVEHEREF